MPDVYMVRHYPADPEIVFGALVQAAKELAKVRSTDVATRTLRLATKASAMSWGANLTVSVQPDQAGARVEVTGQPRVAAQQFAEGAAQKRGAQLLDRVGQLVQAASPAATAGPPAGWYVDPHGGPAHRWWNGSSWTEHLRQ